MDGKITFEAKKAAKLTADVSGPKKPNKKKLKKVAGQNNMGNILKSAAADLAGKRIDFSFDEEIDCDLLAKTGRMSQLSEEVMKYYWQRYRLFSKFDRGIAMDQGGPNSACNGFVCKKIATDKYRKASNKPPWCIMYVGI
ncbi:MAG: hypothetical protein GY820_23535 [Gammaproteobacteria bacterium]|nr:hypothetical protein [Gammaproteobacteria bacterium]